MPPAPSAAIPAGAVVSVRLRERPFGEVVADMVDGVLAANRVPPADAPRLRSRLVAGLEGDLDASPDGIEPAVPTAQAA